MIDDDLIEHIRRAVELRAKSRNAPPWIWEEAMSIFMENWWKRDNLTTDMAQIHARVRWSVADAIREDMRVRAKETPFTSMVRGDEHKDYISTTDPVDNLIDYLTKEKTETPEHVLLRLEREAFVAGVLTDEETRDLFTMDGKAWSDKYRRAASQQTRRKQKMIEKLKKAAAAA